MTGTRDSSPIGETTAEDRRIPYDSISRPDQYLVTFQGGDHMIFSGRARMSGGEKDEYFQKYILTGTTAFWDAYLKDDARAKQWLDGDGFKTALGASATIERKALH
jgi:hypothetical protein